MMTVFNDTLSGRIRLLVVDDSVFMQMAIRAMVGLHPQIEIVGEAADGEQAVAMALTLRPDVITMDVSMPGLDGLEATRRIMAQAPTAIVMLSSMTEAGMETTARALRAGAVDAVPKSSSALDIDLATIAEQVAAKILFWGGTRRRMGRPLSALLPILPRGTDLIAVSAGAGGPTLVRDLMRGLDQGAPGVPVLVMQEMQAGFTVAMVELLARATPLDVREGGHRVPLTGGTVTVMPGGRNGRVMREADGGLVLDLMPGTAAYGTSSGSHPSEEPLAVLAGAVCPTLVLLPGGVPRERVIASWAGRPGLLWDQAGSVPACLSMPEARPVELPADAAPFAGMNAA